MRTQFRAMKVVQFHFAHIRSGFRVLNLMQVRTNMLVFNASFLRKSLVFNAQKVLSLVDNFGYSLVF